jgi:hypothetical protein
MKIPKKIKIGGYTYKVLYKKDIEENKDGSVVGLCEEKELQIIIKKGQIKEQILSTFLHEWAEAANRAFAIHLKHQQIEALESALYQFIQENGL